jgi:hypothetical protein
MAHGSPYDATPPITGTDHALPDTVQLPSLHEVLGEDPSEAPQFDEISLFEDIDETAQTPALPSDQPEGPQLATDLLEPDEELEAVDDDLPIADEDTQDSPQNELPNKFELETGEVDDPADGAVATPEPLDYRSADQELDDIDDFEDLEEIDGHRSPEPHEPNPSLLSHPKKQRIQEPKVPEISIGNDSEIEIPDEHPVDLEEISEDELAVDLDPEDEDFHEELQLYEDLNYSEESRIDEPTLGLQPDAASNESPEIEELELAETQQTQSNPRFEDDLSPPELLPDDGPVLSLPMQDTESDGQLTDQQKEADPIPDKLARDLFNPESGLAWQDHLEQRLSFELDRAASFDQDLSIALVRFATPPERMERLNYAKEIRTYFPFHDLCFEIGKDSFAIALPNTDIDQAIRTMENFNTKQTEERPGAPKVYIGLSARNGRLLSGERLLTEAESAVSKANDDRKNAIFALRVDPGKYREYIKSTLK